MLTQLTADPRAFNTLIEWLTVKAGRKPDWIENTFANCFPHRIFDADKDTILKERDLGEAFDVAWRFIQNDENKRLSGFDVRISNHENFFFNEINYGPMVQEVREQIERVSNIEELNNLEYSFLRLDELKIMASWFRANKREDDFFCPVKPSFYGLEAGKLYSAAEFLPIVVNAAEFFDKLSYPDDMEEPNDVME